jgi:photosystem I reaction center subunit XII|uniref:Photosystem I reaction center subunit XII n=2 Tax=Cyanidioschyzon merolae TaxID=45157 RepID=Q85G73_CYAM1|nr:photosystem I reaction center subunit M [Cyanidioschyzon merolae strain 10D]5ZGB_M Chain M, PsaM [Cyanidioschyzon merolae strain 10D]5ZGH_M Chain M, PsaM [Cyanidioschyzon merolae strain 10D]6FOS_M Chain M, Photosystem I reaction center subunit XII [Cyanidioschyzon merolae strain 10D]6LY5_m Chain m, PsaM [Chaetoceros gracilis]QFV16935.1 photosystem I reaction center subunit M [Cyanidioschyzon merolae]QFV17114.1 photosystem I reaction center subunit M [Cyanidioschyzon merolae]BAC76118.1 pho
MITDNQVFVALIMALVCGYLAVKLAKQLA